MQQLFIFFFIIATFTLHAQTKQEKRVRFPEDFIGNWKGEVKWHRVANDTPRVVKMQLNIQPADSAGHYTWHLVYGEGKKDDRPYILKPVDPLKGHWVLDELNGIFIDHYFVGNRLSCAFTVQNSTIISNCWREGDKLVVEFYSTSAKPVSTTGLNTEDSPIVNTYALKAYQRAELMRDNK